MNYDLSVNKVNDDARVAMDSHSGLWGLLNSHLL